jgi:hypothetical protein
MLRYVEPKDISFEWDRVREGLLAIKPTTSDDWLPEDIYTAIKGGHCALHIGEDEEGNYLGFLVMQLIPSFHGQKLHIWCAYAATKKPLMRMFFPQIQDIARQAKATKISFSSMRDEWERVSKRLLGFKQGQTSYEFDL